MKIKKLLHILFLVFLCPIALGSVTQKGYFPQSQTEAVKLNQMLNLSSGDLGLKGPVSLSAQYSSEFGYMLEGQWTQKLGLNNALSLLLNLGPKERRLNATWGHVLTPNQRFKLTAEYLEQNKDFDFLSGSTNVWIGQSAYGLTYQYLFPHSFINDINFNTFYSHASSKNLSNKLFTDAADKWINIRRIAGGTEKSASLGVDLLPLKNSLLGLQVNYDNVHYDTRYEQADNSSGLGATVSLNQLISKHIKLNLLASSRQTDDTYQAGLSWLLHSKPGTQLELGLTGTRTLGRTAGMENDSRIGVNMSYSWGGDSRSKSFGYQLDSPSSTSDLASWTSQPAVHMAQVLAAKDETKVKVVNAVHPVKPVLSTIDVKAGEDQTIDIANYVSNMKGMSKTEHYAIDYPSNHNLTYQGGKLTVHKDSFKKTDLGKTYPLTVHSAENGLLAAQSTETPKELLLKVVKAVNSETFVASTDFKKGRSFKSISDFDKDHPLKVYGRYTGTGKYAGDTKENGMFTDTNVISDKLDIPDVKSDVKIERNGVDVTNDFTINWNKIHATHPVDTGTLEISSTTSTPTESSVYTVTVKANSIDDVGQPCSATQTFTITVGTIVSPTITPSGMYLQVNTPVTKQKFATIIAGSGTTLPQSATYDKNAFQKDYGLTLSDMINGDKTQDIIYISGIPTQVTVPGSEPTVKVTATNALHNEVSADLKLYIDNSSTKPTITINSEPKTYWQVGHAVEQYKIATITAGSGTLNKVSYLPKTIGGLIVSDKFNKEKTQDVISIAGTPEMAVQKTAIAITATNTAEKQATNHFDLSVISDSGAPVINVNPYGKPSVNVGKDYPAGNTGEIFEIQAGKDVHTGKSYTIDNVTFDNQDAFKNYGLQIKLDHKPYKGGTILGVTLAGTAKLPMIKPQNWPSVTITVKNSAGKQSQAAFTLDNIKSSSVTIDYPMKQTVEQIEGSVISCQTIADIKSPNGKLSVSQATTEGDFKTLGIDKINIMPGASDTEKTIQICTAEFGLLARNKETTATMHITAKDAYGQKQIGDFTLKVDPVVTLEITDSPTLTVGEKITKPLIIGQVKVLAEDHSFLKWSPSTIDNNLAVGLGAGGKVEGNYIKRDIILYLQDSAKGVANSPGNYQAKLSAWLSNYTGATHIKNGTFKYTINPS